MERLVVKAQELGESEVAEILREDIYFYLPAETSAN
jgi:hypothetical protein